VNRWVLGWLTGALVVVIAASLLVTIIALCRRIVSRAREIEQAIDGARERTSALFEVTSTNAALERITGDLRTVRERLERT
jgi:hypothetical protein